MIGEAADVDAAFEGLRIHLGGRRREHDVDAEIAAQCLIRFECARIAREIFRAVELCRVDEDGDDEHPAVTASLLDERRMPGVQGAHRWHKARSAAFARRAAASQSLPERADRLNTLEHAALGSGRRLNAAGVRLMRAGDRRRGSGAHVLDKRTSRRDDDAGKVGVLLRERRHFVVQSEQV